MGFDQTKPPEASPWQVPDGAEGMSAAELDRYMTFGIDPRGPEPSYPAAAPQPRASVTVPPAPIMTHPDDLIDKENPRRRAPDFAKPEEANVGEAVNQATEAIYASEHAMSASGPLPEEVAEGFDDLQIVDGVAHGELGKAGLGVGKKVLDHAAPGLGQGIGYAKEVTDQTLGQGLKLRQLGDLALEGTALEGVPSALAKGVEDAVTGAASLFLGGGKR